MGLDDRLYKDQQRVNRINSLPDEYYEAEADWLMYKEKEKTDSINRNKGVFAESDRKSLNTRPSVFDETAVFRTQE